MTSPVPTVHSEEWENATKEGRPVLLSRLFRYDHLTHEIPLGSLVEVEIQIYQPGQGGSEVNLKGKCKLFVVGLNRDCDGTPLYTLSDLPVLAKDIKGFSQDYLLYKTFSKVYDHGYSVDSLKPTGEVAPLCTMAEYKRRVLSGF
jgi:hypothetical protein